MNLFTSWLTYFSAFGSSDAANANMALFDDTMDAQKSKSEKINDLIKEEDTVALVMGRDGKIKALHSFKKLGGTRTRTGMKLVCLLGSGARANGIVIDTDKITKSKEITLPRANFLWECSTINELANVENKMVPSPPMTPSATLQRSN
jgi:hypothetical protein